MLEDEPEIPPEAVYYWTAFWRLRRASPGDTPIPLTNVVAYLQGAAPEEFFDSDDFVTFVDVVQAMDSAFLDENGKAQEKRRKQDQMRGGIGGGGSGRAPTSRTAPRVARRPRKR